MTRLLPMVAATLALAGASALADDPKPVTPQPNPNPSGTKSVLAPNAGQYHPAGTVSGKVASVSTGGKDGGTISLSVPAIEPTQSHSYRSRQRLQVTHKDQEFQLADDVKVRFQHPPKTLPPRDGLPGYHAEPSDLHAGQVVKLTLGKKAEPGANLTSVKPVVTMVTIEVDTPAPKDDKKGDKKNQ
jgi:hypothetical protein